MGIIGLFALYRHISVSRYNTRLAALKKELTSANKKLETISYLDGLTGGNIGWPFWGETAI